MASTAKVAARAVGAIKVSEGFWAAEEGMKALCGVRTVSLVAHVSTALAGSSPILAVPILAVPISLIGKAASLKLVRDG